MLAQQEIVHLGTEAEAATIGSLMLETETEISDAPVFSPNGAGLLLLLGALALSPKEPKRK